jgi:hypothetical protein
MRAQYDDEPPVIWWPLLFRELKSMLGAACCYSCSKRSVRCGCTATLGRAGLTVGLPKLSIHARHLNATFSPFGLIDFDVIFGTDRLINESILHDSREHLALGKFS